MRLSAGFYFRYRSITLNPVIQYYPLEGFEKKLVSTPKFYWKYLVNELPSLVDLEYMAVTALLGNNLATNTTFILYEIVYILDPTHDVIWI